MKKVQRIDSECREMVESLIDDLVFLFVEEPSESSDEKGLNDKSDNGGIVVLENKIQELNRVHEQVVKDILANNEEIKHKYEDL